MCGISITIHCHDQQPCKCLSNLTSKDIHRLNLLRNRGPSSYATHELYFPRVDVVIQASVLHIRGLTAVSQPVIGTNSSNILLWNGEIFDGLHVSHDANDTVEFLSALDKCDSKQEILNTLSAVKGPWAFIYLHLKQGLILFGRDIIGRRSLLWQKVQVKETNCNLITVSSVSDKEDNWWPIPAAGIFTLSIFQEQEIVLNPWSHTLSGIKPEEIVFPFPVTFSNSIQSPIGKPLNKFKPAENTEHFLDFSKIADEAQTKSTECFFESILTNKFFRTNVRLFLDVLGNAVACRISNHCFKCLNCSEMTLCDHSTIGILFSGGLDCSVLAILADRHFAPGLSIDLINVSFEHQLVISAKKKSQEKITQSTYNSPDRISALESYNEIKTLCPNRKWNLVEVNTTKEELRQCRENRIRPLIHPLQTVLDDSIGCATWFAARGIGQVNTDNGDYYTDYTCPARILLLGMGADEQLGGYSRHRNQFQRNGWGGLAEEIELEINRISERNLARDDRIISDHGREARFPYLDEEVVSFLNDRPIWIKALLSLPRGLGEKILLRAAAFILGLRFSSSLPKRAIQFGSRIAHLETKDEKGSDLCKRLEKLNV